MKNNPWIKVAAVWVFTVLLTVVSVMKMTGIFKKAEVEETNPAEHEAFEKMLKSENEKETEREGKIIVLKSSIGGMVPEMTMPSLTKEDETKEETLTLAFAEQGTPKVSVAGTIGEPEGTPEPKSHPKETKQDTKAAENDASLKKETNKAQVDSIETVETVTEPVRTEPETMIRTQEVMEAVETTEAVTRAAETKALETTAAETQAESFSNVYTCTFNCNINRSGRWEAGDDDCFTLEVYGAGSGETVSMEYFSYDTKKIDALYENYPELDPSHSAAVSERFGGNKGVISYRCENKGEVSYINILPKDGIIAVEGDDDAGMRFYTGEGYNADVLNNYEKAVSDGFTEGDEIVLK